jgi:hypothetical protein
MITRTRRRLLMAARALRDQGVAPPGAEDPSVYRARSGYLVTNDNENDKSEWQDVYAKQLAAGHHPAPPTLRAAE